MNHLNSYIAGQWVEGSAAAMESACPAIGRVVAAGQAVSPSQVDQAFAAAREAFGSWWDLGTQARIDLANAFADQVKQNSDELAEIIAAETGKLLWETKTAVSYTHLTLPTNREV